MYKKIDDKPGYYLGLVLFTFAIPVIGAIGYWMAHQNTLLPSDERTSLVLRAPAPAAEAPAAEAPAAEAPAAEAAH
jgi:hypothetical protein